MSESPNLNHPNFVIVKLDEPLSWSGQESFYPVMPREEPHTYATLHSAAELVASLIEDFHHTPETTRIYRLMPISDEEALQLIENALQSLRQEHDG